MPTLVLPPRYTPDTIAVGRAAAVAGWVVERLSGWRVPEWLRGQDVVLYGEPLFASVVAPDLGLALLEPPFDWLPKLPTHYRHRDVRLSTLEVARRLDRRAFVKPADDKCFPAGVLEIGAALPRDEVLGGNTAVLIADPVRWEVEFRCFVREREVVTVSVYLRNGELAQDPHGGWADHRTEAAREFARTVCTDPAVELPPAVVVDVGVIDGVGWAVIEANAAWGSGIYGCVPSMALHAIERACIPATRITRDDEKWVVTRPVDGT